MRKNENREFLAMTQFKNYWHVVYRDLVYCCLLECDIVNYK